MNIGWNVKAKPMCKKGEEGQKIKLQEDTNVGNTCVKGCESGFLLRELEDSYKYSNVRECDKNYVQSKYTEGHKQTIDPVNMNIFCSQLHNGHVFTV